MRLSLLNRVEDAHDDAVWSCAWATPDLLITGSVDESVKLWGETEDRLESKHTYTGHTLGVVSVAVEATGTYAASSALDSFIRVWNLKDSTTKAIIETQPSETWQITFAPPGDQLQIAAADLCVRGLAFANAGGSTNMVKIWSADSAETAAEVAALALPAGEDNFKKERFVLSVAYSPDGKRLACGSMDGTVGVFDTASGKLLHTLDGHFKPVRALAFTPDSKMLLTACDDMHSHLYDVESASLIEAFSGHESWVLSVAVHPSGSAFVTGSSDSKVRLFDLQQRQCAQTVAEHSDQVWSVAFREDGTRLASVSDDKSVLLHDFVT